jgi:hypothetical protein
MIVLFATVGWRFANRFPCSHRKGEQYKSQYALREREAIMQAVILFWRGKVKRTVGDYHTGVEVWMAYTRRLQIEGKIPPDA